MRLGKETDYGDYLKCQSYLQPNNVLTIEQQKQIFSHRVIDNEHLYKCELLNEGQKVTIPYIKLFNGTLLEVDQFCKSSSKLILKQVKVATF